jgi:hypothetical protein
MRWENATEMYFYCLWIKSNDAAREGDYFLMWARAKCYSMWQWMIFQPVKYLQK